MATGGHNSSYTCHQYGSHALQRVALWEVGGPASPRDSALGHWVVFVHGGAWRDPRNSPQDWTPSINQLLGDEAPRAVTVCGFASIGYRLSPHAAFPQDADMPRSERCEARHPDHLQDVRAGLGWLAGARADFVDGGYVLVGHSAGATLALQVLMGEAREADDGDNDAAALADRRLPLPAAVIGLSGIYDLVGLNARHDDAYADFLGAAFGADRGRWRSASPALFAGSFRSAWPGGTFVLMAHSPDDSLVDGAETQAMAAKLVADGIDVSVDALSGDHDFVWQDGTQVAVLVSQALARLQSHWVEA